MANVSVHFSQEILARILCYFTIFLFFVYIMLIMHNAYKYWRARHNIIVQKRYCHITMYTALIMVPKLAFNGVMYCSLLEKKETSTLYTIYIAVNDLLGMILYYLWVWRFWLIFFDTKWIISILNRRWQNQINPKHHLLNKKQNWFLLNRLSYGSSKWVWYYRILPVVILSISITSMPPIILSILDHNNNEYMWNFIHLLSSSIYYLPFILLAVILCKLPEFNDEFFIISELKRIFITFCVDIACHLGVFLVPTIIEHNTAMQTRLDNGYVADKILFPVIGFNIITLSQTVAMLISTKWVMNKVHILSHIYDVSKANIKIQKKNGFSDIDTVEHSISVSVQVLKLHHTQSSLAQELINKHTFNYGDDLGITLIDVLTNEQSFDIFVKHLSLEYSLECLLSLIEFIQFQQMIDKYICRLQVKVESRRNSISNSDICSNNSVPHVIASSNGNINGDKTGIITNFTNQIFSSNKTHVLADNSPEHSLINNVPDTISDNEYRDMKCRRFLYNRIKFPLNIPKSKIVYDDKYQLYRGDSQINIKENINDSKSDNTNNNIIDMDRIDSDEFVRSCKLKAFTLYRKYIVGGCGLEINVGWSIRKKLLTIMGNNNKNVLDVSLVDSWDISLYGLIKLFDQCCNQMLVLMKDSFERFKQTKQFDKLKKGLFSNPQRIVNDISSYE
eukprot:304981_1